MSAIVNEAYIVELEYELEQIEEKLIFLRFKKALLSGLLHIL